MFNFFKKKGEKELMIEKYKLLLEEAYTLSKINRTESDAKTSEAAALLEQIEKMV